MHSTSFYYAALDWMSYLHHPPPSSWVAHTAATFRVLALLLILPCIFITALDVASYLVVRTLGADSAHRHDPVTATTDPTSKLDDDDNHHPPMDHAFRSKAPTIAISTHLNASASEGTLHPETCFATSSTNANFALAGEGIFSPPASRPASPPIMRSPRAACFGGIAEGEDVAFMRKRG